MYVLNFKMCQVKVMKQIKFQISFERCVNLVLISRGLALSFFLIVTLIIKIRIKLYKLALTAN